MEKIATPVDPSAIPGSGNAPVKKVELQTILLKNVACNGIRKDIEVQVVPFNSLDDDHVEFAYNYSDMLFRAPSPFKTVSDAAKGYVALFMVHKKEDTTDTNSNYSYVMNDLRACRSLFNQDKIQQDINDFFENA